MTRAWRIHSTPGGMKSLAATTPEQAGDDVARALQNGAHNVEVEEFELRSLDDIEDAWGTTRRMLAIRASTPDARDTIRPARSDPSQSLRSRS